MASWEIASEASLRNYIDRPLSEQLRACSGVLSDELSGEGHVSHCNRVLRLCHPEQSSISLNISPPHSVLETKKTSGKTIAVCEL